MTKECHGCTLRNNIIFETKHWRVILNTNQNYFGRFLVFVNRHVGELSSLSAEEWGELQGITQKMEKAMKKAFPGITVFNWGVNMNHAFKEKPFNPHVHWQVFPRHEKPITFEGMTWTDTRFGELYDPSGKKTLSPKTMGTMLKRIQSSL